uniref:Uncharacterized protein n=1 Tax=Cucumis melo TaxID=3656 RepID=A0A1S4DZB0_CUCME
MTNKPAEDPLQPHPVKEQLPGIQYCINSPPPWPEAFVLGFQHYVLTLGFSVLIPSLIVPQMGGGDVEKAKVIQTLLFVSGLNTLFQSLFGTRLPVVVVGSYAYLIPTISIVLAKRYASLTDPQDRFIQSMQGIQGALIVASCFQMVMGFLGFWRNTVRFFSPLSVVPCVTFTGLGLYHLGFPMLAKCVEIGLPGLIIIVFISQYLPHLLKTKKPIYDRYSVLFSIVIIWLYAQLLTSSTVYNHKPATTQKSCRTDQAGLLSTAPWIYIPYPFQWGGPTFNAGEAFAMMAASVVSLFESTGTFFAASRYGSATPVPASIISRGSGWLGVGVLLNGMFGSVTGTCASVFRTKFILGTSFFLGLSIPQYFREYYHQDLNPSEHIYSGQGWFNDVIVVIFISHATIASLVALILDCTLFRENDATRKDSGLLWWEKFCLYSSDVRNDEFYALPFCLNKLFPSV